jgi:cytoskeletal protein RodZ
MSYILDALRKSEEQRQKSRTRPAGSGYTFIRNTVPPKKKFSFALILTSCMLLAGLILGAGWWWSQEEQRENTETDTEMESVGAAADAAVPKKPEEVSAPAQRETPPPAADESPAPEPPPLPVNDIPYLSEMSSQFQAKVPDLQFSGHVYSSEPGLRLIMINNKVVREGDPLDGELTLDEISEDGVVIRYGQTRFRIKLF